ncbi:MAG TPA: hypothetical protein PL182_13415, partial [Pseudobdellovibrionaceae bacterium]|nr:hypothetical protein [Pseudobdellovibrionaceae bacterium]
MDQDPPLIEEGDLSPPPETPVVEEKKRRFSVGVPFRPRIGKKGFLAFSFLGVVSIIAALGFFTSLPLSLTTGVLAE